MSGTCSFLLSLHADAQELSGKPWRPPDRARLSTGGPRLLMGSIGFLTLCGAHDAVDKLQVRSVYDFEPSAWRQ